MIKLECKIYLLFILKNIFNIGSCKIRLPLSNLKDLLRFGLDYVWDNIKRKKSNISFLISSYLNYGGTLNSLVAYNNY